MATSLQRRPACLSIKVHVMILNQALFKGSIFSQKKLSTRTKGFDCGGKRQHSSLGCRNDGGTACTSTNSWHQLTSLQWEGTAAEAMSTSTSVPLSPTWKVLLLSDGSVTRHLQLMTGSPVVVECLEMTDIGNSQEGLPDRANSIAGPRVQRQVLLRPRSSSGLSGKPLVYASSWWSADHVHEFLPDRSKPIWENLSAGRLELYREVHRVFCGSNAMLEEYFGCEGPFWGRQYFFWHHGEPLTLIYEVFSNDLALYVGDQDPMEVTLRA